MSMSADEYRKAAVDAVQKLSVDVGIPTKLDSTQRRGSSVPGRICARRCMRTRQSKRCQCRRSEKLIQKTDVNRTRQDSR